MARRQVGRMVVGLAVERRAAVGLDGDEDVAEARRRGRSAMSPRRLAPGGGEPGARARPRGREEVPVARQRQRRGRSFEPGAHQAAPSAGMRADSVALRRESPQDGERRGRRVEADGMGEAAVPPSGIVGEDQRDPPLLRAASPRAAPSAAARSATASMPLGCGRWTVRQVPRLLDLRLEETTPARSRPSSSGSATCIARSAGRQPARRGRPGLLDWSRP